MYIQPALQSPLSERFGEFWNNSSHTVLLFTLPVLTKRCQNSISLFKLKYCLRLTPQTIVYEDAIFYSDSVHLGQNHAVHKFFWNIQQIRNCEKCKLYCAESIVYCYTKYICTRIVYCYTKYICSARVLYAEHDSPQSYCFRAWINAIVQFPNLNLRAHAQSNGFQSLTRHNRKDSRVWLNAIE